MEEQQILDFVRRACTDDQLRHELETRSERVLEEQGFSPAVLTVVKRLIPHLTFATVSPTHLGWWR